MAIYHFSAQVISRSTGRSSTAAAAYRAGEVVLDERTGEVHDYTRKRGVMRTEILAPAGAPAWVFDRSQLWSRVELVEKRKDSQVCREVEISIPHELTPSQGQLLMIGFAQSQFVAKGMVADIAFHRPGSTGDNRNFHAHVMLTMRKVDGEGFGQKERSWNSDALLQQWREQWAIHANRALEQAGHDARIDHRSHADRGIEEVPTSHYGPAVSGLLARCEQSDVSDRIAAQAAEIIGRQLLNAQASSERLRIQAEQAEAEVRLEMEAEWIQAELVEEAAAVAERETQFAQLDKEQAEADAAAEALAKREVSERERADRELVERQALERVAALAAVRRAEADLQHAEQREQDAAHRLDELRPARDFAVAGLERAGQSMMETIKAAPHAWAWQKAVAAFDQAHCVWQKAAAALARAKQALASAWKRLEGLDPRVQQSRRVQADKYKEPQTRIADVSKKACAQHLAQGMLGTTIAETRDRIEQDQPEREHERDTPAP